MSARFAVVDLFAGPGGLAEGFSSIRNDDGLRPFQVALSIEKERSAFETLRFRSFFRQFEGTVPDEYYQFLNGEIAEPDWAKRFPSEWTRARREALQLELGSKAAIQEIDARLRLISERHRGNVILIGGPPCQAYSLVGRARNKGIEGYDAKSDPRHFLYKEYIRILEQLMPAVFVMENVKGLLSSSVDGKRVFDQVLDDLRKVGKGSYRLLPLTPRSGRSLFDHAVHCPASDFVVRAEDHGIPQSRHRVIILGIRNDVACGLDSGAPLLSPSERSTTVQDVLHGMPVLRSGLSSGEDSEEIWLSKVLQTIRGVAGMTAEFDEEDGRSSLTLFPKVVVQQRLH
ncbi:DNA cytosine methyltransferase [Bradyrhizobium elkanii]|uniref:DNA cytosine methyltransferase n=1 Tax=Bradyrhizobium elkanii TaxID=29448 RepID=UPI001BAE526E|nr:DNA cytosine methyltransferase [Bradyrhizobium elkanii]MBR1161003.1 DNA cytosine methyltransferase [Bradyrhizobium elkanii]